MRCSIFLFDAAICQAGIVSSLLCSGLWRTFWSGGGKNAYRIVENCTADFASTVQSKTVFQTCCHLCLVDWNVAVYRNVSI